MSGRGTLRLACFAEYPGCILTSEYTSGMLDGLVIFFLRISIFFLILPVLFCYFAIDVIVKVLKRAKLWLTLCSCVSILMKRSVIRMLVTERSYIIFGI